MKKLQTKGRGGESQQTYQAEDLQDAEVVKEHEASREKGPLEIAEGLWGVSTWRKRGDGEPRKSDPLLLCSQGVQALRSQPQLRPAWCLSLINDGGS